MTKRTAVAVAAVLAVAAACSQLGVEPDAPASIELPALPSPSVVIGDTLRDANGVAAPVHAIVRNLRGDPIEDADVTYIYADYNRDSALMVDAVTGYVVALRTPSGEARIAARVGAALQVLRPVIVTIRPDSLTTDGVPAINQLITTLPDTSAATARSNTSSAISVGVRSIAEDGTTQPVRGWVVSYSLVSPANASNDTTMAVYLVNSTSGSRAVSDTTGTDGIASIAVRVRAALFPTGSEPDSVILSATASYKGVALKGTPVRLALPVLRGSAQGDMQGDTRRDSRGDTPGNTRRDSQH